MYWHNYLVLTFLKKIIITIYFEQLVQYLYFTLDFWISVFFNIDGWGSKVTYIIHYALGTVTPNYLVFMYLPSPLNIARAQCCNCNSFMRNTLFFYCWSKVGMRKSYEVMLIKRIFIGVHYLPFVHIQSYIQLLLQPLYQKTGFYVFVIYLEACNVCKCKRLVAGSVPTGLLF